MSIGRLPGGRGPGRSCKKCPNQVAGQLDLIRGDPVNRFPGTEPGQLAFGVAAVVALQGGQRIRQAQVAADDCGQVPVTQALHGFQVDAVALGQQLPHLIFKTPGHHPVHPPVDALVEHRSRPGQTELQGMEVLFPKPMALVKDRQGFAGHFEHLQRPDDPIGIVGMDSCGSGAVNRPQAPDHALRPLRFGLLLQSPANRRIRRPLCEKAVNQRLDVKTGPSHDKNGAPARNRPANRAAGHRCIGGSVEILVRINNVDHVVGSLSLLRRRRLSRADIHTAIDLHGIGPDNLAVELTGQVDGQAGLAGAGGTDNKNDPGQVGGLPAIPGLIGSAFGDERFEGHGDILPIPIQSTGQANRINARPVDKIPKPKDKKDT